MPPLNAIENSSGVGVDMYLHLVQVVSWCTQAAINPCFEIKQQHSPVPLSCIPWLLSGRLPSLIMHQFIGATVVSYTFFLPEILPQPSLLIPLLTDLKCVSQNINKHLDYLLETDTF